MDTEFLVEMRQSNKYGSLRKDEIFNLHLGYGAGALTQHPLPRPRHHQHLLIPSAQTNSLKKTKNTEMRFNFHEIVAYCFGVCTQKTGLREVDLEPSPKRGSNKINMLK